MKFYCALKFSRKKGGIRSVNIQTAFNLIVILGTDYTLSRAVISLVHNI